MSDNWQNRAANMRCDTCTAFVPKVGTGGVVRLGRCRRHAPTISGFPVVFPSDWCLDHRLDENRIGSNAADLVARIKASPAADAAQSHELVFVPSDVKSDDARAFYEAGRIGADFDIIRSTRVVATPLARRFYDAGRDGKALVLNA